MTHGSILHHTVFKVLMAWSVPAAFDWLQLARFNQPAPISAAILASWLSNFFTGACENMLCIASMLMLCNFAKMHHSGISMLTKAAGERNDCKPAFHVGLTEQIQDFWNHSIINGQVSQSATLGGSSHPSIIVTCTLWKLACDLPNRAGDVLAGNHSHLQI